MPQKEITFKKRRAEINIDELATIMVMLRKYSKYWEEHYGYSNRVNKKNWEAKADAWIKNNVNNQL